MPVCVAPPELEPLPAAPPLDVVETNPVELPVELEPAADEPAPVLALVPAPVVIPVPALSPLGGVLAPVLPVAVEPGGVAPAAPVASPGVVPYGVARSGIGFGGSQAPVREARWCRGRAGGGGLGAGAGATVAAGSAVATTGAA